MIDIPNTLKRYGISPVIGVILMVAITVTLAAIFGFFATNIGQENSASFASLEEEGNGNGTATVRLQQKNPNVKEIRIVMNGSVVGTLSETGETETVRVNQEMTYISVNEEDSENVLESQVEDKMTASELYKEAPSNLETILNNMEGSGECSAVDEYHDPYIITNIYQLQAISEDPDECYYLGNNINASPTSNWDQDGDDEAEGFNPIQSSSSPFSGTLDGQEFNINSLYINITTTQADSEPVGMFGGNSGIIRNLNIINASVTENITDSGGPQSSGDYTAIAVGENSGDISRVHVEGTVEGQVGVSGIAAINNAPSGDGLGEVSADVTVVGESGLAGITAKNESVIFSAVSHGTYTQIDNPEQNFNNSVGGGIVADNKAAGTVSWVYSTADITTESPYTDQVGGLVGSNKGYVANSYWDTESTRRSSAIYSKSGFTNNVNGLTTSEMTGDVAQDNMPEIFNYGAFETVNGDYPIYKWSSES